MDSSFKIRNMTIEDLKMVITWANEEDWYFSLTDIDAFFNVDPSGYFIGELDDKPICSFAALKYGEYCFWTLYIVKEKYRGKGYGSKILEHARTYSQGSKVLGLDAAVHNVDIYLNPKNGFKIFCETMSFFKIAEGKLSPNLIDLKTVPIEQVIEYDMSVFGYPRRRFLELLLAQEESVGLGVMKDNKLVGIGIIRRQYQEEGYFLAPLEADSKEIADEILEGLQSFVAGKNILGDVFACNTDAVEMMYKQGWKLFDDLTGFKRMYAREQPKTDFKRVYSPVDEIS